MIIDRTNDVTHVTRNDTYTRGKHKMNTHEITDHLVNLIGLVTELNPFIDEDRVRVNLYLHTQYGDTSPDLDIHCRGDNRALTMKEVRQTLGGKWTKSGTDYSLNLLREIDGVNVTIAAERTAVCTAKVVGTRTVTFPAVEAQEARTEEREIIEWDCGPILPADSEA